MEVVNGSVFCFSAGWWVCCRVNSIRSSFQSVAMECGWLALADSSIWFALLVVRLIISKDFSPLVSPTTSQHCAMRRSSRRLGLKTCGRSTDYP